MVSTFSDLSYDATPAPEVKYTAALLFVYSQALIEELTPKLLATTAPAAKLWFAYPKKSSAIKADIDRDRGWNVLTTAGYRPVAAISINETWSALRFRPEEEINTKSSRPDRSSAAGERTERKPLEVPDYLQQLLDRQAAAKAFFESLSYTHQKEYLHWITEAKKRETRERRLEMMMMEMLQQGKKGRY